ncbi:S8 family serine peptidase [Pilimelia columellifera]
MAGGLICIGGLPGAAADTVRASQWHLRSLAIGTAHSLSQGDGVTVAVIDTGVDADHPDLVDAILAGKDFREPSGNDLEVRRDMDRRGHGTSMTGLIAGRGRGGAGGVLGIAPKAKVLPVRHTWGGLDFKGETPTAIRWAAGQGAKVISMSFGDHGGIGLELAIREARAADVLLVASAGNRPESRQVRFPARYDGVVAVGAVDRSGRRAGFSVTGPQLALTAPGVGITSTRPRGTGGGYGTGSGTSDATAIVAGVAALVRARYPDLSAPEVVHRMTSTADDKGPAGRDEEYGFGIVNPVRALTAEVPPLDPAPDPVGPGRPGDATTQGTQILPGGGERAWSQRTLLVDGAGVVVLGLAVGGAVLLTRTRRRRP